MPPARDAALTPATQRSVEDLSHDVRRGTYDAKPPAGLAKRVAETLIQVVATADGRATLEEIIASVRAIGGSLAVLKREHLLVGNVARRVLRVIRDEGATSERGDGGGESGGGEQRLASAPAVHLRGHHWGVSVVAGARRAGHAGDARGGRRATRARRRRRRSE